MPIYALTLTAQEDKCKPKKCKQECKKSCPVVRMGKQVQQLYIVVW